MPRLPTITAKQLISVLQKRGFLKDRQVGSHVILVHYETDKTLSVPVHPGKTLGRGLVAALLKDAAISREEFLRLL